VAQIDASLPSVPVGSPLEGKNADWGGKVQGIFGVKTSGQVAVVERKGRRKEGKSFKIAAVAFERVRTVRAGLHRGLGGRMKRRPFPRTRTSGEGFVRRQVAQRWNVILSYRCGFGG